MKLFIVFAAFVLVSQYASADCPADARKCYDNTNAPPALVYRLLIDRIFSDSLDYLEDLDSLKDEEYHAGLHFVKSGVTPNMSSADVVLYFIPKFLEIEKEVEEAQEQMLCVNKKPRYEGAESFLIFNQMDEMALNIYEKHLYIARSELQASGLFDLDKAIREFPGSFGSVVTELKDTGPESVKRLYELAESICSNPSRYQFIKSVSEI